MRRRPTLCEQKERQGREETGRRLLELRDELKLERGRLDGVLRVGMNGSERLALERRVTAVVHEYGLQRGSIARRWRSSEEDDARCCGIVQELDARRERNFDTDGRMLRDARGALGAVIKAVTHEKRIVGILCQSLLRVLRRERTILRAVAGGARAPVASERLFVEEASALLEPLGQANEFAYAV